MANHYDTLGVRRGCTPDQIRSAHRKLVLIHHPDRTSDPKSRDTFIKITEAYEVLSDPARRREYDRSLAEFDQRRTQAREQIRTPRTAPKPRNVPKPVSIAVELTKLVQLYSRGRMVEAEAMARDLVRRAPTEAIPYGVLGDILRSRGNLLEAGKMYAYAAQYDPRNPIYQRRHEELIAAGHATGSTIHIARDREAKPAPLILAAIVSFLCGIYVVLSRETPIFPGFAPISTFTLGLVAVLFFAGVAAGSALSLGGWLDRFESTTMSAVGKRSPSAALGLVAIVNFWAAALLYVFIGLGQRAFNYSTSRVIGAVSFLTILFALCASASYALNGLQVCAWGGNLVYLGAILGWMIADAFRA